MQRRLRVVSDAQHGLPRAVRWDKINRYAVSGAQRLEIAQDFSQGATTCYASSSVLGVNENHWPKVLYSLRVSRH